MRTAYAENVRFIVVHSIPVIDVAALIDHGADSGDIVAQIAHAAEAVGFFSVVGHQIPSEQIAAMRTMAAQLFSVPDADKQRQAITRDNYRGFIPLGFFTPNRDDPAAPAPDRYEGFKLHWEVDEADPIRATSTIYGPNRWPDTPTNMRGVVLDYWASCDRLATALISAFETTLRLSPGSLLDRFTHPVTNMTVLHYPPSAPDEDVHGIHPHKDTNVLTLLYPDPVGGLFVRTTDGTWIEASPPSDAMLINTGDMMEVWSGGRFPSTPHKVVNTTGTQRYAFPWFLVPSHDQLIEPLVEPQPGFARTEPIEVGPWSLEVWRTNWPDAVPADKDAHLGTLDQS